jgi:hypothetical protein
MKAKWSVSAFAVFATTVLAAPAWASYCGATRYDGCVPCSYQQDCHTVTKTVRTKIYEQQEVTCYRTVYDQICESRVINVTRMVPETRQKEVSYTVCKPVWETRTREYTVCKPVWETRTREYTVCKPVWETRQKEVSYTVCKPVWETRTREYTVCKPVWETRTREESYHVHVRVPYTKTIQVQSGRWETQQYEVPGKVYTKTVREVGTFSYDPAQCKCVYCPGPCVTLTCQAPPKICCKRVWVPECIEKQITCYKTVCEPRTRTVCYKVCTMVPEVRTCNYQVCKMVPETRVKTVCYKVCKMVPETRTCCYKVCTMVPETRTCTYKVCKMVPETCTKIVNYTVCVPHTEQRTVQSVKCVPRQIAYTVKRCVPKIVCQEVPVTVGCPCTPSCCD